MTDYPPKFQITETTDEMLANDNMHWHYVKLQFDEPNGPKTGDYGDYYMYSVEETVDGIATRKTWFPSVSQHEKIQAAGAIKGTLLKVSKIGKEVTIAYHGGPQKTIQAPATPPPPPSQPGSGNGQPPAPKPASSGTGQPTRKPVAQPPISEEDDYQTDNVYFPRRDNPFFDEYWELMAALSEDRTKLLRIAFNDMAAEFSEELQDMTPFERMRILHPFASGQVIYLEQKTYHMWDNGSHYVVNEQPPDPSTQEGALVLITGMEHREYPDKISFIRDYLMYLEKGTEHIDIPKAAANIAKRLGVDSDVLYNEVDANVLKLVAEAIWFYAEQDDKGESNDSILNNVALMFGMAPEFMEFDDEATKNDATDAFLDAEPVF